MRLIYDHAWNYSLDSPETSFYLLGSWRGGRNHLVSHRRRSFASFPISWKNVTSVLASWVSALFSFSFSIFLFSILMPISFAVCCQDRRFYIYSPFCNKNIKSSLEESII